MLAAQGLATKLEKENLTSLIAISRCDDVLVLTDIEGGNTLKYGHMSLTLEDLDRVPIKKFDFATSNLLFNEASDAVLAAGLRTLLLVLPPPRGHGGILSLTTKWTTSELWSGGCQATIVDAIFPRQFDDHVCALNSTGVLCFWHIYTGSRTKVVTGIQSARAFCFGTALF